jgi:RNA-binding protein
MWSCSHALLTFLLWVLIFMPADNTGMPALQLTPAERKDKRGLAHHLDPVVMIGADGLTPAVEREVDLALKAHGLIKVRMFSDDRRRARPRWRTLADTLNAAPVQHIGKLLVLWRPPAQGQGRARRPQARPARGQGRQFSKSGNHRARSRRSRSSATSASPPAARSSAPASA